MTGCTGPAAGGNGACVHGDSVHELEMDPARRVTDGDQAVDRTARLTFLSKVRAATAGRRPDFRPREGGHRSGTVPELHRLRDRTASDLRGSLRAPVDGPSVARAGSPAARQVAHKWPS